VISRHDTSKIEEDNIAVPYLLCRRPCVRKSGSRTAGNDDIKRITLRTRPALAVRDFSRKVPFSHARTDHRKDVTKNLIGDPCGPPQMKKLHRVFATHQERQDVSGGL
jgi:hypothetical protein